MKMLDNNTHMKTCSRCKKKLNLTAFHMKGRNNYQTHCKLCSYEYQREWYKENRERLIDKISKRKERYRLTGHISWIKNLLTTASRCRKITLSREEKHKLAVQLEKKLLATTHCPYTGEKLYPGVNVSLDHKNPVSRFPKQAFIAKNLQWVSKRYNIAKNDLTDDEFAILCKKVSKLYK